MSNYFNEDGEPLMDGSAMRYEMYLDCTYEPDVDDLYDYAPDFLDGEDCPHDNCNYRAGGDVECIDCDDLIGTWVRGDNGWPVATYF